MPAINYYIPVQIHAHDRLSPVNVHLGVRRVLEVSFGRAVELEPFLVPVTLSTGITMRPEFWRYIIITTHPSAFRAAFIDTVRNDGRGASLPLSWYTGGWQFESAEFGARAQKGELVTNGISHHAKTRLGSIFDCVTYINIPPLEDICRGSVF